MGDLRLLELSGSATGGQLRLLKLSGALTAASQLRLLKLSGTITYTTVIANAGANLTSIEPGTVVTLDGSASVGSTFAWTCVSYGTSGPPSITSATSATATYIAPSEFDDVNLVFRLTVDGTATDDVAHQIDPQIEWRLVGSTWEPAAY
jgi:hypothetical protein